MRSTLLAVPIAALMSASLAAWEIPPDNDTYFQEHYRVAGETAFGDIESNAYRVLVRRDRPSTGTHPSSMPCLA